MAKKQQEVRPFYDVTHEYQASLKEYLEACMLLRNAVGVSIKLAKQGANTDKMLFSLIEHYSRCEKAAHGGCDV